MRAIPSPNIIIKDYKTINKKTGFPTRLVIPTTNFTATFSKLTHLGIRIILDKENVSYSRISIVKAYKP